MRVKIVSEKRPNRFKEDVKNEDYHRRYARHLISKINLQNKSNFINKSLINHAFYKGNQWIFNEDLDAFLMDESGSVRNRIKFVHNIIRPFVEYYTGTAIKMDINFRAIPTSAHAANRRDMALSKMLFFNDAIEDMPEIADIVKNKLPVGDTREETIEMHQNLYKDEFVEKINWLIQHISEENDMEDKKVALSKQLALDGIGVLYEEERNGEQVFDVISSNQFFFDTTAKRSDLLDASFMGDFSMVSIAELFESSPNLDRGVGGVLDEDYMIDEMSFGYHSILPFSSKPVNGKAPLYRVFWDDIEFLEYGCFKDENDNFFFTEVEKEGSYVKKNLVTPPDGFFEELLDNVGKKESKRNKSRKIAVDCCRFCYIIPHEHVDGLKKDLVVKFGKRKIETKYSYNKKFVDKPYKVYCWSYIDGEILSPLDDLIDTQRYINRLNSIAESQINNSRGSGIIYDKDMIDSQDGEENFLRDMNMSKPIGVNGEGNLNNSVMPYDNTIKAGTFNIFNIVGQLKNMANDIFGGGDALLGSGGGYRVSVGAVNQNLQQATTTQEPFFYALSKILEQATDSMANRGKKIYCMDERKLSVIIGDDMVKVFKITKDMSLEDFKITIKRSSNPHEEREIANQSLIQMLSAGLVDESVFSKYYGNITMGEIGKVIRESFVLKIEAEREAEKQRNKQARHQSNIEQSEMELASLMEEKEDIKDLAKHDSKMETELLKQQAQQAQRAR